MFCMNTCKVHYVLSSTTMLEFHTADEKQRFENYGAIGNIIRRRLQAWLMTAWKRFQRGQHERAEEPKMDIWKKFSLVPSSNWHRGPRQDHGPSACVWFHYIQQVANGKRLRAFSLLGKYFAGQKRTARGQKRSRKVIVKLQLLGAPQSFFLGPRNHANRVSVDQGTTLTGSV